MSKGVIKKVAGPLVIASGMRDANMFDVVRVSMQVPHSGMIAFSNVCNV